MTGIARNCAEAEICPALGSCTAASLALESFAQDYPGQEPWIEEQKLLISMRRRAIVTSIEAMDCPKFDAKETGKTADQCGIAWALTENTAFGTPEEMRRLAQGIIRENQSIGYVKDNGLGK